MWKCRTASSTSKRSAAELVTGEACDLEGHEEKDLVARVLELKTIAVIGCSPKPERAGHYVPAYMKEQGYKIVPVNPGHDVILGEKCYPTLEAIPFPIDVVNVFRRPDEVPPIFEDAVQKKAKAVWLQSGITHPDAERYGRDHGLLVVSDACMMVEHRRRHA